MATTVGKLTMRIVLPWWAGLYIAGLRLLARAGMQFDADAAVRPVTNRIRLKGPYPAER